MNDEPETNEDGCEHESTPAPPSGRQARGPLVGPYRWPRVSLEEARSQIANLVPYICLPIRGLKQRGGQVATVRGQWLLQFPLKCLEALAERACTVRRGIQAEWRRSRARRVRAKGRAEEENRDDKTGLLDKGRSGEKRETEDRAGGAGVEARDRES
ncbi:hypothetical protein KM043_006972 [Ampulex compressa]|nr:hypothetical protein KM043_006972 [Ampulex compressa]